MVVAAARAVADPKGFLSIKDVTKLLLPEEKEERWGEIDDLTVTVAVSGDSLTYFLT